VEAPGEGYLLRVMGQAGDILPVGSILAWLGSTADEPLPSVNDAAQSAKSANGEPTLKALLLLKAHGLRRADVPHSGRLTAADVERHAASRASQQGAVTPAVWPPPQTPGRLEPFSPERKAMMRTVSWHRDQAAAGYVELSYDPVPWENFAADFQQKRALMISPLLSLMAWRLAQLAAANSHTNATAASEGTYLYDKVNLGFTVQAGASLYLVVVRDAAPRSAEDFVRELGELQRAAMKHALTPEQSSEATIGFTSMARWKVSRHIPVLAPQTALMVAHSAPVNGTACLGASYDHRLLTGFDAVHVLQKLAIPPGEIP